MRRKSSSPKSSSPSKRHRGGSVEASSSSQPYVSSKPQRKSLTPVENQSSTSTGRRSSDESIIGDQDDILLDLSYGHVVLDSDHSNQTNILPSVTPTNVQQQQQHVFTNSTVISESLEESTQRQNINDDDEIQIIPTPHIHHPDCPECNPNIIRNNFNLVPPPPANLENVNIPQFNTNNPNSNNGNMNNTENDLSMEITAGYNSIYIGIHGIGLKLKRHPEICDSGNIILRQLLDVVCETHGKLLLPEYIDVAAAIPPISSSSSSH